MTPTRIHHLNFIVRDLAEAEARFSRALGTGAFTTVDHAVRGAAVSRVRIGETWLVLVCPYDHDSVPGQILAANGEGFFLLSVGVEGLQASLDELGNTATIRDGILDWRVADVDEAYGAILQLTEERDR